MAYPCLMTGWHPILLLMGIPMLSGWHEILMRRSKRCWRPLQNELGLFIRQRCLIILDFDMPVASTPIDQTHESMQKSSDSDSSLVFIPGFP